MIWPVAVVKNRIIHLGAEALWVLCGQVGVAFGGLISIKVLTHLLNPNEFGRLTIANTIIVLVGMIFFGPLGQGLMRFWSISDERNEINLYNALSRKIIVILASLLGLTALIAGIVIFFSPWHDWVWITVLSILTGTFVGWAGIRLSILIAARKRKNVAIVNSITAFAKPGVAAAIVIVVGFRADAALIGYLIATGFSVILAEFFVRIIIRGKSRTTIAPPMKDSPNRLRREIFKFSLPFLIWGGFAWAHQSCDRWAILSFSGADAVGAYSVISQLAFYPLVFGSNFLSTFFIPIAYERAGNLDSESAVRSGNWVLISMTCIYITGAVILMLLFTFSHRALVLLISNENFVAYSYLLPWLTGAWSLYYLGQILSGFGLLVNKPQIYLVPIVSSGILASSTVFILGSQFGIKGVIWAIGISCFFYASWCLLIAKNIISSNRNSGSINYE